jgi:hypothetical protein
MTTRKSRNPHDGFLLFFGVSNAGSHTPAFVASSARGSSEDRREERLKATARRCS